MDDRWKLMSREGEDGFGWVTVLEGPLLESDGDTIEVAPASEVERLRGWLQHIAVHGDYDQECRRPPQDCAADALEGRDAP